MPRFDSARDIVRFDLTTGTARRLLGAGLALGILFDLLRSDPPGLNATLWVLAMVAAAGTLRAGRFPAALAVAALFSLVFTWRGSELLFALSVLAILASLVAGLVQRPSWSGLGAWVLAAVTGVASAIVGSVLGVGSAAKDAPRPRGAWRIVVVGALGVILAAPLLLILGSLFASADPLFAHTIRDFVRPLQEVAEHGGVVLAVAWLAGGGLVALAAIRVTRGPAIAAPAAGAAPVLVAVGLVGALFLLFLGVQARALFGGRAVVESTLGLSYAEYARQGFFQLVASCAVALPPLLAADWAVPPGHPHRRRFIALAGALALMVLLVLTSAARRLALYVGEYGLTEDRLLASAFLAWLALSSVAFALTVLRGARERFAAGALGSAAVVLGLLAVANPDALIVRTNLGLEGPPGFDAEYASRLGADAAPALVEALPELEPADRCTVAASLLKKWGASEEDGWRSWNAGRWRARAAVASARAELADAARGCYSASPAAPIRRE